MKKFILAIGSVLTLVACNQVPPQSAETANQPQVQQSTIDTAGLSSFRQWKVQNELADVSEYQARQDNQSVAATKPAARKQVSSPSRTVSRNTSPTPAPVEQPQTSSPDNSVGKSDGAGAGTGTANSGTGETTQAEKKEGWSKAAKGAVIGGVTGAAGGAVINKKNRVVGAVVGAVIGAGGGYAIGRGMDKKDGRIEID